MTTFDNEIAELLPFYANGTLSAADRARVEAALTDSILLREELAEVQYIAGMVKAGGDVIAPANITAPKDRLDALLSRIEADAALESRRVAVRRAEAAPATSVWSRWFAPRWQPAFAMGMLALIVVQGAVIAHLIGNATIQNVPAQTDYTSLSGPDSTTVSTKTRLMLRLSPEAKWSDIKHLLESANLNIVAGPHDDVLEVEPANALKEAERDRLITTLKASPLIEFVGVAS